MRRLIDDAALQAIKSFQAEYHAAHAACPQCGSTSYRSTSVGYIIHADNEGQILNRDSFRDENKVECDRCKWVGTTHDLVHSRNSFGQS